MKGNVVGDWILRPEEMEPPLINMREYARTHPLRDEAVIAAAQKDFDVGEVYRQFGTWAVTDYGIECLESYYPIDKTDLYDGEPNHGWLDHMAHKTWVNYSDFARCLAAGRAHHDPNRKTYPKFTKPGKTVARREAIAPKIRFAVLKRDGYRCCICGGTSATGARLHVDHKHPVARGGTNDLSNLWSLCADCNLGKGIEAL